MSPGQGAEPVDSPEPSGGGEPRLSRRVLLGGGLAAAAVGFLGGVNRLLGADPPRAIPVEEPPARGQPSLLGFEPVPPGRADAVVVPKGYTAQVIIPWGEPILSSGPAWKQDGSNTATEQAQQFGMAHDGMHFFPAAGDTAGRRGLLVLNHEHIDPVLLFPEGLDPLTPEKVNKGLAAHGVSVVTMAFVDGAWRAVDSPMNRRITGATPMTFSGPVPGDHPALAAKNPPVGTLNNCANGHTPWGTYLTCEENWDGYFGTQSKIDLTATEERYGLSADGRSSWHTVDRRFDLAANRKEPNRFGWVVEIDPADPASTPVKRTALGRMKHENAAVVEGRGGRIAVYTGDDSNGEYLYKFVGSEPWRRVRGRGHSPLDHGTLHVARFDEEDRGTWVPLIHGEGPLTTARGWTDQADVLLRTRQAADAVRATKLDRPEWVAVHPTTSEVFVTLTGGSSGPSPVNPRNPNPYGSIVRLREPDGDHEAPTFRWDIFLLAGDPQYDASAGPEGDDIFGSPDGLTVDPDGRLWIATDVGNAALLKGDRGYDRIGNNQVVAADPRTGDIRRFLVGPPGCEVTGITFTPDQETMFVNIQHPGEATDAIGAPTPDNPRLVSNWPDFDPEGRPRAATVVIRKAGGGRIGT
jgi:secreted PhoX family phosphatase